MAPPWRSRRGREVVAGGILLGFCVASILMLSRVLTAVSHHPRLIHKSTAVGKVAKPPLYPTPQPLLDLDHFQYLTNADPCGGGDVTGVLIVTSHADHVELRSAHRRAYPRSELLRLGLRRVFLLARQDRQDRQGDADAWVAGALRDEAQRFNDIVQGDFKEAYRNLTYKHTMGLQWAARYCPQALLVIKMDDDIVVDLYQLMDYMNEQRAAALASSIYGYVLHGLRPSREPANKWFVTREEYAGDVYPDFLSGWVYVTTPGVARALAEGASRWTSRQRYFWIDDLLLTGMVREALAHDTPRTRLALHDLRHVFTVNPEVIHCCLAEPDLRCDVLVGPNGGENDLVVRFQAHAARCHYGTSCAARPPDRLVERTCVVRAAQADSRLPAEVARDGHGQANQVRMF